MNIKYVIDLGSQNDYDIGGAKPPFISEWYKSKWIEYSCIDLAGDNDALEIDLSEIVHLIEVADMIVDAGTSEHVVRMKSYHSDSFHDGHINSIYPDEVLDVEEGFYNCWMNKFINCRVGGFIVSENPKHGHWPDHGYHYITQEFYHQLAEKIDAEIVEIGEHAASGNSETGMNVFCILRKTGDNFTSMENFWALPIYKD